MKNFKDNFKKQYQKKMAADSHSTNVKEVKKKLSQKNLKGKIVLLSPKDINERNNIRDDYDYEQIESLARDIVVNGQLEPVVVTADNYLLWGYRRLKALEMIVANPSFIKSITEKKNILNNYKKLVCYQVNKESKDITDEELQDLQLAENQERRDIDNFQLSKFYNSLLERGYSQSEVCQKYGKSKTFVSAVVKLKNIDEALVKYLKEFQVYGCSKEKFIAINSQNGGKPENINLPVYNELKKIVGWQPLYSIAKHGNNLKEQKKAFLKLFKGNLTKEELNSDYFTGLQESPTDNKDFVRAEKQIKTLSKTLSKLRDKIPPEHQKLLDKINQDMDELQEVLQN